MNKVNTFSLGEEIAMRLPWCWNGIKCCWIGGSYHIFRPLRVCLARCQFYDFWCNDGVFIYIINFITQLTKWQGKKCV